MTVIHASKIFAGAVLFAAAAALAGCETTGSGPQASAKPAEPPMTHTRAARECWMATEKGRADINLDKRADIVTRCIDRKMTAARAGAEDGRQANAKKP